MDGPKRLEHSFFSRVLLGTAVFFAAIVAACLSRKPNFIFASSEAAFVHLAKSVSERRKLPLTTTVKLELQEAEISRPPPQSASTQYDGSVPIAQVESIYKDIGLLGREVDFARVFAEYQKILRLAAFDRATGVVRLSHEAIGMGAPLENTNSAAARELPVVIGIMQALQEQNFHWQQKIDSSSFVDHRLALRAVATGDALLAAVGSRVQTVDHKILPEELRMIVQIGAEVDKLAVSLPAFLRAQATFPYREGGQFVSWAYSARGWQGVNGLYANPPVTTAQVLHPEKYFIQRQNPLRFFPAALLRREKNLPHAEQSLGEFCVRTLLETYHSAKSAAETAANWRGDQLFSFQKDNDSDTFWFSAWENEAGAKEFLRAYADILDKRLTLRFEAVQQAKDATVIADGHHGRAWLLQARGATMLALVSRSGEQLTKLADQAWESLEVEPDTTAVHFEIAQRQLN